MNIAVNADADRNLLVAGSYSILINKAADSADVFRRVFISVYGGLDNRILCYGFLASGCNDLLQRRNDLFSLGNPLLLA